jgi:hypothetical protein
VEKLKSELQLVLQKIQAIDATLRDNEAEEKED